MLRVRNRRYYILIITFFLINLNYAQSTKNLEKQIKIYVEKLQSQSNRVPHIQQIKYYPIYDPYFFQRSIEEEKSKSAALCNEYLQSEKFILLCKIYTLYINEDTSALYNLIDENGTRIYDLHRFNCSGMKNKIRTVDTVNQSAMNDLIKSYNKWYQIIKQNGIEKSLKENILPTSFSKYKWVKEIGFLKERNYNQEIYSRYLQIMKDSTYLNYFINSQGLRRFYKEKENAGILKEIIILTLINNQKPFTSNVLNFSLTNKSSDTFDVLNELEVTENIILMIQTLKNKNITIALKI